MCMGHTRGNGKTVYHLGHELSYAFMRSPHAKYVWQKALVDDERDETMEGNNGTGEPQDAMPKQVLYWRVLQSYLGRDAPPDRGGLRACCRSCAITHLHMCAIRVPIQCALLSICSKMS